MPRLDTQLESQAAEFLVVGRLLLERISAYKTYTNMPVYDLVATHPERGTSARIQVKSRWRSRAPGFPLKNCDSDFVGFCRLNRGNRKGTISVTEPEFYVFPTKVCRRVRGNDSWYKVVIRNIRGVERYRDAWHLIGEFLEDRSTPRKRRVRS